MLVLHEIASSLASSEQPIIRQIYEHAGKKLLAIGLRNGIAMPEYIAPSQAMLMVVQGEIDLNTATHSFRLERFDSFDIPPAERHSVVGVFDAIFLMLLGDSKHS